MTAFDGQTSARRTLLRLVPAALAARLMPAQKPDDEIGGAPPGVKPPEIRLPNGRKQQDEILKADYEQNLKDARELVSLTRSFEEDLEKEDRFVLSLASLKKLDDIEKISKRIRGRLKKF